MDTNPQPNADRSATDTASAPPRNGTLNMAGYAYMVGDAGLFASGMMAGRYKEALTGALYAAGGITAALYGTEPAERALARLSQRLSEFLRHEGVEIPEGSALTAGNLARKGGVIERISDFLYDHPTEVLNSVYAVAGFTMLQSGWQTRKALDGISGALVTAGALAGLLIPETKPDPNAPAPEGTIGKLVQQVQANPLKLSSALYTINNFTLAGSAFNEMRAAPAQKSYLFKFLTAGSFLVANNFLRQSSKQANNQHGDALMAPLAERAAAVIAAQKPELQEAVVAHTAGFLAAQPGIHHSAPEIAQALHAALAQHRQPAQRGL